MVTGHPSPELPETTPPGAAPLLALVEGLAEELHPGAGRALRLDSSLAEDAELDSLARVELLLRVQRRFGVALPDRVALSAETVADLLAAIEAAPTAGAPAPAVRGPAPELTLPTVEAAVEARTLAEVLQWHAGRTPDCVHVEILGEGEGAAETITYAELQAEAGRFAGALAAHDLGPRPAVGLMLPTSREFFVAFFGVLLAGGVPVPLYPPFRASQVEEHVRRQALILRNAECRMLVTTPEAVRVGRLLRAQVPGLREVATLASVLAGGPRAGGGLPRLAPEDLALLQYTSGSTGDPKGVELTHANLLANIRAMGKAARVTSADVFVSWLPLYHDMGLIGAWLGALTLAFPLVVMSPGAFLTRPSRWLWAIHRHRGTLSAAPNFAYEICASRIDEAELAGLDLSGWRRAFNGAEPVSPRTLESFTRRFAAYGFRPEALAPVYGLAESSVGLAFPPPGRAPRIDHVHREPFERGGRAVLVESGEDALAFVSSGLPLPGHELRVVDPAGRELPERVEGRLQFRGPSATRGYHRNPEADRQLLQDGWLEAGDLGYLAGGEVFVTGRAKDVIIRAGRHFFPYEVEEAVGALPGVRKGGVVVFAVPDESLGTERVVVLAETRVAEPARREELRRSIADVSAGILGAAADEVLLVPPRSVPKTSSGKLRRSACRELYRQGLLGRSRSVRAQVTRLVLASLAPRLRRTGRRFGALVFAAWFWGLFGLLAPVAWLAAVIPPGRERRRRLASAVVRAFFRAVGAGPLVEGLERLPPGPVVVVANHASYLDGLLLTAALPPRFTMVAKSELRNYAFTRSGLRGLGAQFVERFDPERGAEDTERLVEAVARGESLIVFAEGTLRRAPGIFPFHMGAFLVAARTGVPLAPVVIAGSRTLLRGDQWFPRRGSIRISVLPPLVPHGAGWEDALALHDQSRRAIAEALGEPLVN